MPARIIDPVAWYTVGIAQSLRVTFVTIGMRHESGTMHRRDLPTLRALGRDLASLATSIPRCLSSEGNAARDDTIALAVAFSALLDVLEEDDPHQTAEQYATCDALFARLNASIGAVTELPVDLRDGLPNLARLLLKP